MLSRIDELAELPKADRDAFVASLTREQATDLYYTWRGVNAREDQVAPDGDWDIWLVLAGRGWGKTRAGAEWIREQVNNGAKRIALIAETQKDLEEVMVEGDSGILNVFPPDERPEYKKKPVQLIFPNGAKAFGYNATQPDQLRGPQFDAAWCDELAKWRYARETWDQLQFGLRLGEHPKVIITTTPRPIELVKSIAQNREGSVAITKGRTLDNAANLAAPFLKKVLERYSGTRLGRQELEAEILGDLPGALWRQSDLDLYRLKEKPYHIDRIVIGIDPAVTNTEESDEHGIIVAAKTQNEAVVLEDCSMQGSPHEWANEAVRLFRVYQADCIVVEVNNGGDMVAHTLRTIQPDLPIREVRASRGKHVRAEPIAALYEQGRVRHVGQFPELEGQMTQMTNEGYMGDNSPDRLDACVWALTELFPGLLDPIIQDEWEEEDWGRNETTGY